MKRRYLTPLSLLYRLGSLIDRTQRRRQSYRSSLPVLSVGNIASGGTGKTQFVLKLVEKLQMERPVMVLSRGYGRNWSEPVIWRTGDPSPSPAAVGDEPAMIASAMNNGAIGINSDRAPLLKVLEQEYQTGVVILDDGFQHHQIARDIDFVMIDAATTQGSLIPVGELRESFTALRRANVLVVDSPRLLPFAERWKGDDALVLAQQTPASRVVDVERVQLDLVGRPVIVVTGIAHPERVVSTIKALGATVVGHRRFRDHVRYDDADIDDILESIRAHRAVCAVTTQKDAVKLSRFNRLRDRLGIVELAMKLEDEGRLWSFIESRLPAVVRE